MRPFLSRIPRKTKVTAVVLGAALVQVGVLAALGLDSSRSRLQTRREDLAMRAREVVKTRVIAAAHNRLDALEQQASRELSRVGGRPSEGVRSALAAMTDLAQAPIFIHGFVVEESGDFWHVRRPPFEVPTSLRDETLRRRLDGLKELEHSDPRTAMVAATALADEVEARPVAERDSVAAARALRVGWRAALRSKNTSEARRLAQRVVDDYVALRDDRAPPEGDSEPFGIGAGEVVCSLLREAVSRSPELRDSYVSGLYVQALVDRRVRAQRLGGVQGAGLDGASYGLEREACKQLLRASTNDLRVEDKRFIEAELQFSDSIDLVSMALAEVNPATWTSMLSKGEFHRVLVPDVGGARLALVLPIPPFGDGGAEPRRAAVFPSEAAALRESALQAVLPREGELPEGVRLVVQDENRRPLMGPDEPVNFIFEPLPFGDAAPGLSVSAYLIDPGALDREIHRERNFWLWTLAAAGLAVIAASLLAIRARAPRIASGAHEERLRLEPFP